MLRQIQTSLAVLLISIGAMAQSVQAQTNDSAQNTKAGKTHKLLVLEATSDATPELDNKLSLILNESDEIVGFHFADGQSISANYTLENLKDRIVLYKRTKFGITKDINYISSDRFDSKKGGHLELTLLREFKSIFSFDYRLARLSISKNEEGQWQVFFDDLGKTFAFDQLLFKGLKADGEFVGTEYLTFMLNGKRVSGINTRNLRED